MKTGKYQEIFFNNLNNYASCSNHYNRAYSVKKIRDYVSSLPIGSRILDAGCADGELLAGFAKKYQIYGTDIASKLLKIAKKKGLITKPSDIEEKIPFPNAYFDIVVIHHVIEHLVNTDRFLAECNRVLKKRGILLLTFPNTASFISIVLNLFNLPAYFGAGYRTLHVRDFTLKTATFALKNNGFIIIRKLGGQFLPFIDNFQWVSSRISRFIPQFASDNSVIAKKVREISPGQTEAYTLGISGFNKIISKIIIK